ncbi:chemotaxis protein CheX [Natronospora cellulosivora (SeqCode)]
MILTENIVKACNTTFPMFGYNLELLTEDEDSNLNSVEEVNVLIGLSNGTQGNMIISLNKKTALRIISAMMGGMEIKEIDNMGESALGELANILIGSVVSGIATDKQIDLSPPTIATGQDMYIMISNIPAQKLKFKIAEDHLYISYAIQ